MAKTQKKSNMYIDIITRTADGHKAGTFEITSGNLYYYRKNAKKITKQYTWRNLIKLIESDIEK